MNERTDPQSLGFLLTDVARLLRAEFERRINATGLGLTAGEARTLLRIDAYPDRRQTMLAEHMSIEPMTLCRFVDRLENAGLVSRQPDAADRRAKIITLTEDGRKLVDQIRVSTTAMLDDIQSGLTPQERDALKNTLMTLQTNLTDTQPAAANG